MSGTTRSLVELPAGASATVVGLSDDAEPHVARRLVDLGLVPGTEVTVVRRAPLRDPTLYRFADTAMCLRAAQARLVTVRLSVAAAVAPRAGVTVA
ncbi:FeoA family protein [Nocardioides sp. T2.26MG-1]|uniref:FeoA family protein n=1 Tax=Nocardioides sp. T2.26MG-1 TaxID=3041166 RepID=UPI00247733FC|nr:FeoA family protein [Nocardioides sp. T2.26MG-1]CAI9404434.1 hypothetical protein HIDPHFAB_04178 [Nocardioides sp. T2.26MG-1]